MIPAVRAAGRPVPGRVGPRETPADSRVEGTPMIGFNPRDLITAAQYRRMIREEQDAGDRVHLLHSIRGSEEGPKFIYENDLDTAPMDRAAAAFGNAVSLGAAPPRFAPGPRRTAPGRPGPRGQGAGRYQPSEIRGTAHGETHGAGVRRMENGPRPPGDSRNGDSRNGDSRIADDPWLLTGRTGRGGFVGPGTGGGRGRGRPADPGLDPDFDPGLDDRTPPQAGRGRGRPAESPANP